MEGGSGEMCPEPIGQFLFGEIAGSEGKHDPGGVHFIERKFTPVEFEKDVGGHPGRALVAIDERMIACNPEGIGCGKDGKVVLSVFPAVARSRQCGIEAASIAHTSPAAVLGQLPVMHGQRDRFPDPDGYNSDSWRGPLLFRGA